MRIRSTVAVTVIVAGLALCEGANAELLIDIDQSAQRMTVTVNGYQLYDWPVSTGRRDYNTPNGTFKPFRMEIDHYSEEWDNAPMPYSIFFTRTGNAIHGTNEQRHLGRAVSHGCVRLSVRNAAKLWKLVKQEKMANTSVLLSGAVPDVDPSTVARSQEYEARYGAEQFQRHYNSRPSLPPPFFLFRR